MFLKLQFMAKIIVTIIINNVSFCIFNIVVK